eukprot:3476353-Prymnesium_polylepis.1
MRRYPDTWAPRHLTPVRSTSANPDTFPHKTGRLIQGGDLTSVQLHPNAENTSSSHKCSSVGEIAGQ